MVSPENQAHIDFIEETINEIVCSSHFDPSDTWMASMIHKVNQRLTQFLIDNPQNPQQNS